MAKALAGIEPIPIFQFLMFLEIFVQIFNPQRG
jgi:hypothetical protein